MACFLKGEVQKEGRGDEVGEADTRRRRRILIELSLKDLAGEGSD